MPFPYGRIAMSFTTSQAPFSIRNKLSASKSLLALISILSTILSGCQHNIMSGMITERHNIDCRLIMKAISKGSLAGCTVHMDAGSTDRFSQQNYRVLCSLLQKYSRSWRRVQPNVSWNCLATACAVGIILSTPGL